MRVKLSNDVSPSHRLRNIPNEQSGVVWNRNIDFQWWVTSNYLQGVQLKYKLMTALSVKINGEESLYVYLSDSLQSLFSFGECDEGVTPRTQEMKVTILTVSRHLSDLLRPVTGSIISLSSQICPHLSKWGMSSSS